MSSSSGDLPIPQDIQRKNTDSEKREKKNEWGREKGVKCLITLPGRQLRTDYN